MTSRAQKQTAHRLQKQRKEATRAKKKKQLASRVKRRVAKRTEPDESGPPRCGLCGATTDLVKTECCEAWICDDEHQYVLFSYDHNSCSRNHRRYTLCGFHFNEGHAGRWQDCPKCRDEIETEMYVYYGTNEYNFDVLKNPPAYQPTHCGGCGRVIALADGGYSSSADGYLCGPCTADKHPNLYR